MSFTFNGNWDDKEQVRPYLARYSELRESGLSYNEDFKGRILGIEGEWEDRAIYMLSCLYRIEKEREVIEEALAHGFKPVDPGEPNGRQKFAAILTYQPGYYTGGTGLIGRYEDARLVFDGEGLPHAVLPKGKRTKGYDASGARVLVRQRRETP